MQSATTADIPEDFDGFLLDAITTTDGVWGLYGIDDDRNVAMWSPYHARRYIERQREAASRVRVSEWALADVTARGDGPCIAKAQHTLAVAHAELAEWNSRIRVMEAARRNDPLAPAESPFALEAPRTTDAPLAAE